MSYQTTRESNGIYQKFWGRIESPELFDSLKVIYNDPQFDALEYVIKDYLDIEAFDVGVKAIVEALLLNMKGKRTNPNIVVAIVTTNLDIIEASNIALSYRFDAYPRKFFKTVADARAWISDKETSQSCL